MAINFEFKARCPDIDHLEKRLLTLHPLFIGEDRQIDTYFEVPNGRMKLREGTIENTLIHYERTNTAGAKQSNVLLYHLKPDPSLKAILSKALGVKAVVDKRRKIYFIDNVKFHFDTVEELGSFAEVEAIDKDGDVGIDKIKQQCFYYARLFDIKPEDFVAESYSDLVLAKKSSTL